MALATFHYDYAKRMSAKHASTCCGAELEQKMLYKDKVVTDPKFKLSGTQNVKVKTTVKRKWYQIWKPKFTTTTKTEQKHFEKVVKYRYYCSDCNGTNTGAWNFKHDNGHKYKSEGAAIVAVSSPKADNLGAEPSAPAKEQE